MFIYFLITLLYIYPISSNTFICIDLNNIRKKKKLKIVRLFTFADWGTSKEVISCSPEEFLGLFMNASFVVCSSFHGTIFSLHFRKPFVSVRMGEGKDNRVKGLLDALGLLDHFLDSLPLDYNGSFDFDENRMHKLLDVSLDYISILER